MWNTSNRKPLRGDFGIALRAIPALLYGEGVAVTEDVVSILGISIRNMTMSDALDWIVERAAGDSPGQICFVNADCANLAYRNQDYLAVLHESRVGAGRWHRDEARGQVAGTPDPPERKRHRHVPAALRIAFRNRRGHLPAGRAPRRRRKSSRLDCGALPVHAGQRLSRRIFPGCRRARGHSPDRVAPAPRFCWSPSERRARTCGSAATWPIPE